MSIQLKKQPLQTLDQRSLEQFKHNNQIKIATLIDDILQSQNNANKMKQNIKKNKNNSQSSSSSSNNQKNKIEKNNHNNSHERKSTKIFNQEIDDQYQIKPKKMSFDRRMSYNQKNTNNHENLQNYHENMNIYHPKFQNQSIKKHKNTDNKNINEFKKLNLQSFRSFKGVKFRDELIEEPQRQNSARLSLKSHSSSSSILRNKVMKKTEDFDIRSDKSRSSKLRRIQTKISRDDNEIVIQKYSRILQGLVSYNNQYKDDSFPTVYHSLFRIQSKKSYKQQKIIWKRLSELYPINKTRVIQEQKNSIFMVKGHYNMVSKYLLNSFNIIRNHMKLLEKIFYIGQFNKYGIYLLNIYQNSQWKYIIIDDYIPVIQVSSYKSNKILYQPAFINIKHQNTSNIVWPLLLEKAYASYYGSYQAILYGNVIDFLQELTGTPFYNISSSQYSEDYIQKILLQELPPLIVGTIQNSNHELQYYNIYYHQANRRIFYENTQGSQPSSLYLNTFKSLFTSFYIYRINQYPHQCSSVLYPIKNTKMRKSHGLSLYNKNCSIRRFTLQQSFNNELWQCCISICQKQHRFYYGCKEDHYICIRCILLNDEQNNDYQWVAGFYSNKKCINFHQLLKAGQYILVIIPEWKQINNHQISLQLFSNVKNVTISREQYDVNKKIIELACLDLAQKKGKLNQISKKLCSYTYFCPKSALMIENINNQRVKAQMVVQRSIQKLITQVPIKPFNDQFYRREQHEQYSQNNRNEVKLYPHTQLIIPPNQSYTVVLCIVQPNNIQLFQSYGFGIND